MFDFEGQAASQEIGIPISGDASRNTISRVRSQGSDLQSLGTSTLSQYYNSLASSGIFSLDASTDGNHIHIIIEQPTNIPSCRFPTQKPASWQKTRNWVTTQG